MGQKKSRIVVCDETSYYVGETILKDDLCSANGKGCWVWDEGEYNGKFKDNQAWGKGCCRYSDSSYYIGNWKANVRHGKGKMIYSDGCEYIGDFDNDMAHGKGKIRFDDGTYYIGSFQLNDMNGYGKLYNAENIVVYSGEWLNGTYHGWGIHYFDGKDIQYEGYWKEGLTHGRGYLYLENGEVDFDGIFRDGLAYESREKSSRKKINQDKKINKRVLSKTISFRKKLNKTLSKKNDIDTIETINPALNKRRNLTVEIPKSPETIIEVVKPIPISKVEDSRMFKNDSVQVNNPLDGLVMGSGKNYKPVKNKKSKNTIPRIFKRSRKSNYKLPEDKNIIKVVNPLEVNPLEINRLNKKRFEPMRIVNDGIFKQYIVNSDIRTSNPLHQSTLI